MEEKFNSEILEKQKDELKEPPMYRLLLLNDDYTTQDFVVEVLVRIFHKAPVDATRIMTDVHKKGKGLVGYYSFDIGATKVAQVKGMAEQRGFPLKCRMEKA